MSHLLRPPKIKILLLAILASAWVCPGWIFAADQPPRLPKRVVAAGSWEQFKYDCRHSGNAPDRTVTLPLGLVGAVPLTDSILTAPVVAEGRIYVIDASGVAFCIDGQTLKVVWQTPTHGGKANCNNISSPAIVGRYLHFGTMAGSYYILDRSHGTVVKEIRCGEPIFSTPVINNGRAYFATLGSCVYALEPDGSVCWMWDFVKEVSGFDGERWSGEQWAKHKNGRVTWQDQFCCSADIAMYGKMLVVPAGGSAVCLEDAGSHARVRGMATVPSYAGSEKPATFGITLGEDGTIYRQWHRRDNTGRVEVIRLDKDKAITEHIEGTQTEINRPGSLSFSSVSVRGDDVYRCRPEEGFGCCKHSPGKPAQNLGGYPSITPPILLSDKVVYGGLDGNLYVVSMSGNEVWSFKTAFGRAISAPAAICDGRVYFGCEDGYLYVLGPGGKAPLPTKDLELWKIRSPLTGRLADSKYDWFTNYGNLASTNSNSQGIEPPFKIKWIRRYEGTFKHLPVCGGGRMYTHTAEGQIFAVEQETGRLLWRRYWPGVHISFTSPIYYNEKLLVPQAGMKKSQMRCLDAATGQLLWEAPFSGSPSWSRQQPPIIYKNLAVYVFGTGKYAPQGTEKAYIHKGQPIKDPNGEEVMSWIYSHDNPYYPKDQTPLIRAWDIDSGGEVWTIDFSEFGTGGNDAGLCLMDDTLYYSCFFGYAAKRRNDLAGAKGLTAAIEPATGRVIWLTTEYFVTAGTTISAEGPRKADFVARLWSLVSRGTGHGRRGYGRLYLGGYNPPNGKTTNRYVWCLDARNGSLIWQSEPVGKSVNVVTIGRNFVFVHGSTGQPSYLIDKNSGKILSSFDMKYACTRFTLSEPYLLGANMDIIDTTNGNKVVSSGPCVDARECVGAVVSNGRIFYTSQANGLQLSQVCGPEATSFSPVWQLVLRSELLGRVARDPARREPTASP